jgi:Fe-S-cluster containining protein
VTAKGPAGRTGPARTSQGRALASLRELYALVPDVGCRGLCTSFCVPVHMSDAEMAAVDAAAPDNARRAGTCSALGAPRCPMLARDGRCSVYDDRPMVCRVWGASSDFRCPHGCEPADGFLTVQQVLELMLLSLEIGGTDLLDAQAFADVRACIDEPGLAEAIMGLIQGDHSAARRLGPLMRRALRTLRQRDDRQQALVQSLPTFQDAVEAMRAQVSSRPRRLDSGVPRRLIAAPRVRGERSGTVPPRGERDGTVPGTRRELTRAMGVPRI